MTLSDLPALNASLNATATVLLVTGYVFIRRRMIRAHATTMVLALATSAVFLTGYLIYHFNVEAVKKFPDGYGAVRYAYYAMLLTHVVLAIVNLPMIILTVIPAARRRFDQHRRIARWTFPIWLYVSVTGVLVYFSLYHWFPG
ncbi:DUF420 domain-containing protein [soil metagenome]